MDETIYYTHERIMKYTQCLDYIRSDLYRVTGEQLTFCSLCRCMLLDVGFRFLFWFRLAKCSNLFVSTIARIIYFHLGLKHKISISRETEIGYGFRIVHDGPVVINTSARIGDNVDLYQYTTIGSMFMNAALIGNEVYIGPSVCIVENVHIGDGVTIGAGAVVVKDIEGGVTVAGNPARVISHKEPGRLVWRKWNREWNKAK